MRFAYADPPYVGQAKKHYGKHADFGGEVDHAALIGQLAEFDAWALSLSVKSLPVLLPLCPQNVLVLAWVKPVSPPMGDNRIYSWEPVILCGGRKPTSPTRLSLVASPPQFTFRERPKGHVIGEKPEAFARWLFAAAGLRPSDDFIDVFPGSGAVGRAWEAFTAQGGAGMRFETLDEDAQFFLRSLSEEALDLVRSLGATMAEDGFPNDETNEDNPMALTLTAVRCLTAVVKRFDGDASLVGMLYGRS